MKILDYLKTEPYLNEFFGVDQMAEGMKLTTQQLRAKARKELSKRPKEIIERCRIDKAKQMIHDDPNTTLKTVWVACGYHQIKAFIYWFRKLEGVNPSIYIQKLRDESK